MGTDWSIPLRIELDGGPLMEAVNVYLFLDPEPTLIDAGYNSDRGWSQLHTALGEQRLAVADLRRVIVTHTHVDHIGLTRRIVDNSRADIWISELGLPWLRDFPAPIDERTAYYRDILLPALGFTQEEQALVLLGMAAVRNSIDQLPAKRLVGFAPDAALSLGGAVWQAVEAPGHTRAMTCLYQPETRRLISADMLLHRTPTPVVEHPAPGEPRPSALPVYLESLRRIEALRPALVFPGHGAPIEDPHPLIAAQRSRIEARKLECLMHLRQGAETVAALVTTMYPHHPAHARMAGAWMVLGYLDLLRADGSVVEESSERVWRYRALQPSSFYHESEEWA